MEGLPQMRFEERRQFLAARRFARPCRDVLENLTRIVRAAEKGTVDSAGDAPLRLRTGPRQHDPERDADEEPCGKGELGSEAQHARHGYSKNRG